MTTLDDVRQLTVADYHKMGEMGIFAPEERVELIEGVIRNMSPIGAVHSWTVKQLNKSLVYALGARYAIGIQDPITLSNDTEPEPDASVVALLQPGEAPRTPRAEDVYLVVEVSDTTLAFDRNVKLPLYARAAIPEVWIIDTTAQLIEQYHTPREGVYQVVRTWRKDDTIPSTLGVEFAVGDIVV